MKTTGTIGAKTGATLVQLLNEELATRCSRNVQYSLRAFAKFLDIDHSTLSQILRHKRALSPSMIKKLGVRVGLDAQQIAAHLAARDSKPSAQNAHTERVLQLTRDAATIVTDWRHLAILELLRLEAFQPDSRWIARMLGISVDDVNVALQRLLHLRLLEMRSRTEWVDLCGDAVLEPDQFTSVTLARLSDELRALAASRDDPGFYRTTTIALDSSQFVQITELVERFRRELAELQTNDGVRDAVYRIDVSLIPLTRHPTTHSET